MGVIILCYILGIAMLYLGFSTEKSEGYAFGLILIICGMIWHYKHIATKKK